MFRTQFQRFYDDEGGGGQPAATEKDSAYWQAEAKKAFDIRDKAKREADEAKAKMWSDEERAEFQALKDQAAQAEEDRKKKAGEFDTLKQTLAEKHAKDLKARDAELAKRDEKAAALEARLKSEARRAAFGAATEYFSGSDASKTILDVDMGLAVLGRYVDVEIDDEGSRVVVKRPTGETIVARDGNPAPFAEAISELLTLLPNKDRILRGSGKSGSGSSGGKNGGPHGVDLRNLTPDRLRDPKVLEALRASIPRGAVVMGSAYEP